MAPNANPLKEWTPHEDALVEKIVDNWNNIVGEYENKLMKFAMYLDEILKTYPDQTAKAIIQKAKDHPKIKLTVSTDRIYQMWRLVKNRPDIPKYVLEMKPEERQAIPQSMQPILKKDGTVAIEQYLELYKRPQLIDETMKTHLEQESKEKGWTVKELKEKIVEVTTQAEPTSTGTGMNPAIEKGQLIKEILGICKILPIHKLRGVKKFAEGLAKEENKEDE
jgi:hypothetical protein